jgi:transaldolase
MHIVNCAKIGADVITGPLSAIWIIETSLNRYWFSSVADFEKGNK